MSRQFTTRKLKPKRPGRANGFAPRAVSLRTDDRGRQGEPQTAGTTASSGLPLPLWGLAFTTLSAAAGQTPWSKPAPPPAGNFVDWVGSSLTPRPAALGGFSPHRRRVAEKTGTRNREPGLPNQEVRPCLPVPGSRFLVPGSRLVGRVGSPGGGASALEFACSVGRDVVAGLAPAAGHDRGRASEHGRFADVRNRRWFLIAK